MIDRDVENSTLASLVDQGIADKYLGRFANGRLEGWLDGFRPLSKEEFADAATSDAIAVQMANLHASFVVPDYLQSFHDPSMPAMWTQLHAWMKQALSYEQFKTDSDTNRAQKLNLSNIQAELWIGNAWTEASGEGHTLCFAFDPNSEARLWDETPSLCLCQFRSFRCPAPNWPCPEYHAMDRREHCQEIHQEGRE